MGLILSHFQRSIEMNNRIKALEDEFKKRYNRDVEVSREVFTEDGKFTKVAVHVVYGKKKFTLTEYFKDDQNTDYVTLDSKNNCHKYSRYVDAEVHMADMIGG